MITLMFRRGVFVVLVLMFSFMILFVSVAKSATVKYQFSQNSKATTLLSFRENIPEVDYFLAYPGKILPDNPLWTLKVIRDRLWLFLTLNPDQKSKLQLLLADKRLASSKVLFEKGKPELGGSTLDKGEQYLQKAFESSPPSSLSNIALSALKHRQTIEEIVTIAPEDARPPIIKTLDCSKSVFKDARGKMREIGMLPPENPFKSE